MAPKSKSVRYCPPVGSLETPYDLAIYKDYSPLFNENDVRHRTKDATSAKPAIFSMDDLDLELDYSHPKKESILSYDTKHNTPIISLYVFLVSSGFLISGAILSGIASLTRNGYLNSGADLLKITAAIPVTLFLLKHLIELFDIMSVRALKKTCAQME
jgi:hypothetical protein